MIIEKIDRIVDCLNGKLRPSGKKEKDKLEMCKDIYRFIRDNQPCSRKQINEYFTDIPLPTIKRYLTHMLNSPIPYLIREGKTRDILYSIAENFISSPYPDNNIKKAREFVEKFKSFSIKEKIEGKEAFERLGRSTKGLIMNGNYTILLIEDWVKRAMENGKIKKYYIPTS